MNYRNPNNRNPFTGPTSSQLAQNYRNPNDRNPFTGLTSSQLAQLNEAEREPHVINLHPIQAYSIIAQDFARRTVARLVSNDLRGALDAAEISAAAASLSDQRLEQKTRAIQALDDARARAEANPNGMLISTPGSRRRKRVLPGDPDHPATAAQG